MGDLTKNFSAWEFTCRHCGARGVQMELVDVLQLLRDDLGSPIHVTSGFRCPQHPDQLKRPGSKHGLGEAADIIVPGYMPDSVAERAEHVSPRFRGIAVNLQKGFTHLDIRRQAEIARWGYDRDGNEMAV